MERKVRQWIGDRLAKREELVAVSNGVAKGTYRSTRLFVIVGSAAVLGAIVGGLTVLPDAWGPGIGAGIGAGLWAQFEIRRGPTEGRPAGPWPIAVVTNERFMLVRQPSFGRPASIDHERPIRDVATVDVGGGVWNKETVVEYKDGSQVVVSLRDPDSIRAALGA